MIVMKFGGTSIEDAEAIRNAAQIILKNIHRKPLVVVSACAGVTNSLIKIAEDAANGKKDTLNRVKDLQERHNFIADHLFANDIQTVVKHLIENHFNKLKEMISSISGSVKIPPSLLDQIMAVGEICSSILLHNYLIYKGILTILLDARKILVTNEEFTNASPLIDLTNSKVKEIFSSYILRDYVVVTQGFIGATINGDTTTIGRGGSDYSAAIFGAALDAEEIQIWSDVDGILAADPSIVPGAYHIKMMTYNEAAELAYFGAKVLHPNTILPAIQKNIPVRVLNSKRAESEGTFIMGKSTAYYMDNTKKHSNFTGERIVKSIAYKEKITMITVQSVRMLIAHGFLARLFEIFAHYKKSVDVVATSEVGVSLTVDDDTDLEKIVCELRKFANVYVEHNTAVLCVVGENLKYTKGIAARVFTALDRAGINVLLISHGGSEINLTFVISESQITNAVKSLYNEFFSQLAECVK